MKKDCADGDDGDTKRKKSLQLSFESCLVNRMRHFSAHPCIVFYVAAVSLPSFFVKWSFSFYTDNFNCVLDLQL